MKWITLLLALSATALAADFQNGKLLDIQPFKQPGTPVIAPNNGFPVVIPTSYEMFTMTVAIGEMSYGAQFRQARNFKASQFIVGDPIQARVDGDKLVVKTATGVEKKAKIIRRERLKLSQPS